MNKRNKTLAVVLALLIVAILTVFIAVVRPLLAEEIEADDPPVTEEGESLGTLGKYRIYNKLDRSQIAKIYVHNTHGEYAFVREKSGDFVIEGLENLPYNQKYFSALVSVVGSPLALTKVANNADGYDEYGITDSENYYIVTDTSGNEYRVNVGYRLHTAGGYYVAYAKRNAVYVLGGDITQALELDKSEGTSLDVTVLKPIEFYVSPVLVAGIDNDDYFITDNFTIYKNGEKTLAAHIVPKEEQQNPDALVENLITFPAEYQVDGDVYYDVLQKVATMVGTETVKAGATEEDYDKYGLGEYAVTFENGDNTYTLLASAADEDGSRYATSSLNPQVIAKVSADNMGFLDKPLLEWIQPYALNYNIVQISKIDVSGKGVDLSYSLRHGIDEDGNATLAVDAKDNLAGTHRTITEADDVWNFRSSYRTALYTKIEDNAPLTEAEIDALTADEGNCVLTYTYTMTTGTKRVLQFWQYSTRRTLLTVNGEGQFYVYLDRAEKILSDCQKVYDGITIDSQAKN